MIHESAGVVWLLKQAVVHQLPVLIKISIVFIRWRLIAYQSFTETFKKLGKQIEVHRSIEIMFSKSLILFQFSFPA